MDLSILLIYSLCKICLTNASIKLIPLDAEFIYDFTLAHDRNYVSMFIPEKSSEMWLRWHKNSFTRIQKKKIIPASYMSQDLVSINDSNWRWTIDENLKIYIPDESNLGKSLEQFIQLYSTRSRADRDYWLLDVSSWKSVNDVTEELRELPLDLDDDLFLYSKQQKDGATISIWEYYEIHPSIPRKLLEYGQWTSGGLSLNKEAKWNRRRDLEGAHFKIVTLRSIPYITKLEPIDPSKSEWFDEHEMEGMFADVWFNLQYIMNFTFYLSQPADGQWGSIQPDGSWTGMVYELQSQRADVAATDFTVTLERSEVMTFANPITQIYHSLFIKNPTGTFNYMAYIEPLHYKGWIMIAVFCILTPPFLHITTHNGAYESEENEYTLGKSIIFALSSLTLRGWSMVPNKIAARIVFIIIMIFGAVLYWHWEAMLISYLATRVITLPFNGIETLLSQSDFNIALNPGTSYEDSFKISTDPVWQAAWIGRIQPYLEEYIPMFASRNLITIPINNPKLALYDNYYSIIAYAEYTACEVIAIPAKYDFKPYAYGFQKNSPYLSIFNHYIKQMRENGKLGKILKEYEVSPQVCPDSSGLPLGFESCFTAFLLLLAGMALGFILFCFEWTSRILCGKNRSSTSLFTEMYDRQHQIVKKKDLENDDHDILSVHKKVQEAWNTVGETL